LTRGTPESGCSRIFEAELHKGELAFANAKHQLDAVQKLELDIVMDAAGDLAE
jgi:hypothetical protein